MELPKAVTLLNQAICGYDEALDESDKLKMASAVGILRDVIPNLLANDGDRDSFRQFVDVKVVKNKVCEAANYVLDASMEDKSDICLNNETSVNCGGPPKRMTKCHLCGRSGRI
jgi:hypothetical protein